LLHPELNKSPVAGLRTAPGANLQLRHQPGSFSRSVSAVARKTHKNRKAVINSEFAKAKFGFHLGGIEKGD